MILTRLIPGVVFVAIFVAHAIYVGAYAASAPAGWTDFGISADVVGPLGLGAYWRGQDYFIGSPMRWLRPSRHGRSVAPSSFVKEGSFRREPLPAG